MRVLRLFARAPDVSAADSEANANPAPPIINTIRCPHCEAAVSELMEYDACVIFVYCPKCHSRIDLRPGDCCVFRSYGSTPCPHPQTS